MCCCPVLHFLSYWQACEELRPSNLYSPSHCCRLSYLDTIRKISGDGKWDWSRFVSALDQVFLDESEDARDISQRKELVAYLFVSLTSTCFSCLMVKNVCGCFIMYDYLLFYGFKETDIVLQYKNNVVHFSFEGLLRKLVVTSKD